MKTSPPVHRVHIECFHTETFTLFNTRGKFFTRSRKVVTYTDHSDFPFSSWSDVSDWPVLETIANQGILIIGMSIERLVEPGDPDTNQAFINFRNRFVQQNCHRDEQVRTWVTSEIPDIGTDPSLFISTKPKEQMPFIFKIGVFLILSSFCLSCPLRTLIRKRTKLIPLKVRKVYFADPDKLSPYLGPMNNGPGHTTTPGFGAKGSMLHNGSHSMQKVLLDAALNQHEHLLDSNPLNNTLHALTPNLDVGENLIYKNICKPGNQKFVLLSPMIGSKPMIMSPIFESRDERKEQSGFVLLPIQTFENTLPIPTFREQTNTDTNIQTQSRILCNTPVITPLRSINTSFGVASSPFSTPNSSVQSTSTACTAVRSSEYSISVQNNLSSSTTTPAPFSTISDLKDISGLDKSNLRGGQMDGYNLQYSTNQQGLYGKDPIYHGKDPMYQGKDPSYLGKDPLYPGKDPLYPGKDPLYPGKDPLYPGKDPLYPGKDPLYPGKDLSGVYLPGKDYYDESLYSGRKAGPPISLHNNFGDGYYEEEERHYASSTHPRVAMLKNTNIETDMRGREFRENRRVHYQERDFRRLQSPSPGPRQRAAYPGQHRSRRADGDESWTPGSGYGYQQSFPEEEVQYNA